MELPLNKDLNIWPGVSLCFIQRINMLNAIHDVADWEYNCGEAAPPAVCEENKASSTWYMPLYLWLIRATIAETNGPLKQATTSPNISHRDRLKAARYDITFLTNLAHSAWIAVNIKIIFYITHDDILIFILWMKFLNAEFCPLCLCSYGVN